MMTPQEVASHVFAKATFGGNNMTMVDEFLDQLTEDYTALYNDNTILKNKLKVLSDSIEEYRATDVAMRKTLLAAQQMAQRDAEDARAAYDAVILAPRSVDAAWQALAPMLPRLAPEEKSQAIHQFVNKLMCIKEDVLKCL